MPIGSVAEVDTLEVAWLSCLFSRFSEDESSGEDWNETQPPDVGAGYLLDLEGFGCSS
jgi:hypothetical protein